MICDNLKINDNTLYFGEHDVRTLAKKYGTPLYVMDEDRIRKNMRTYKNAMEKYFGNGSMPLFASKAASFKQIYRIANEEGIGTDVVSPGEIYTAVSAGFPMEKAYFHGNNKTDSDIEFAMDSKIGYFVADNAEEIEAIDAKAAQRGLRQKILIRLTPGIDPHTYEAVSTGKVDSKFGSAIATGAADEITRLALSKKNIELCGFHCHVGSQVFDSEVYLAAAEIMLGFIAHAKKEYSYDAKILNLGGGYGVRYTEADPHINIEENIKHVAERMRKMCDNLGICMPSVRMEPGRSIVADAGLTLYTVGSVKRIPGYKNYVSTDGGMTDNPRFALYKSAYTIIAANKAGERCGFNCSVVGRCCESGDIIGENIPLPESIQRGDILAVLTTGAYNYAMSSNYNRVGRPPIIMLKGKEDYTVVKGESYEDIARNDL